MSRLIKKSIQIPAGATVTQNGSNFVFKGPKGELALKAVPGIEVSIEGDQFWVKRGEGLENEAMLGTFWSLVKNAFQGVTEGFAKNLEIEGVGYRAVLEGGSELVLYLGYALPVRRPVPQGITIAVDKNTIKISGIDKEKVGQAAAEIRALKKPEPYKGKGIRYAGEVIRRKVGKKAGTTA
ncbi:MAG: 50S ribosomal protein L6 [Patescibacteria group bacterium]|nr:50S ribosomal protein L6 [Patescibacteria group bacterium]